MPHTVLRIYDNAPGLVDALVAHEDDVRALLTGVAGFRIWGLTRTATGAFTLTVCDDKAGTDETVRRAAGWIKTNLPDANIPAPTVIDGEAVLRIDAAS
ncbi:MAG: hypothetical protein JO352_07475 [Chloroflexi bacterium]|nr:hypothetical protein [Chloroflexota bacterium]MBV9600439.1 hypothetical protein [Chloroflexota bacterium]